MPGAFEVRNTGTQKGLGVYASQSYRENETIFEEKPLASSQFSWNEAYGYYACHHCLRPMESVEENLRRLTNNAEMVVPYPELCPTNKSDHRSCESCRVGYCSEICKQVAEEQYHNMLCPAKLPGLVRLIECWKQMHYPPETTSITLIARIIAMIEGAEDRESIVATLMSFCHEAADECEGLYLLKAENLEKIEMLRSMVQETLPIEHSKYFVSEEGFRTLFALIGRNGQGIGTSVLSQWVNAVEKREMSPEERERADYFIDTAYIHMDAHVGKFLNCEGSGLYKLQRCLNHSCSPNARVNFPYSNHVAVLETIRPIEAGEEICISYFDECMLERSRHTRNKQLKDYYLFECHCDKCLEQADQPDETSEEESDDEEDEDSGDGEKMED